MPVSLPDWAIYRAACFLCSYIDRYGLMFCFHFLGALLHRFGRILIHVQNSYVRKDVMHCNGLNWWNKWFRSSFFFFEFLHKISGKNAQIEKKKFFLIKLFWVGRRTSVGQSWANKHIFFFFALWVFKVAFFT